MKNVKGQIGVALVCCILGFMLAYQFKALLKQDQNISAAKKTSDITVEIEQYKKQKDVLEKKVNELELQVKDYEKNAANENETTKNLYKELQNTRALLGLTDVEGEGVNVYLTPDSSLFSNNVGKITDRHLVYLVNELRFSGAEAISINDIRITDRSGIRNAGEYIIINGADRVSPSKRIVIKAIGDKNLLYSGLSFPEVFGEFARICEVKFEKADNIKINKNNRIFENKHIIPIDKK